MGTVTFSNHYKYQLANKAISVTADTIKALLVKSGFVFDPDTYATLTNMKATTGSATLTFSNSASTITRPTGSFITDGFVVGNYITTTASVNTGPFTITVVAALTLTVSESLTDETISCVVTADDELETGFGYTQDGETITTPVLAEDDTDDRAEFTMDNPAWTAAGGNIGPTPGAILYSDTSTDNTILCYLAFGTEITIINGATFTITGIELRGT